jgi:hypothetical protein
MGEIKNEYIILVEKSEEKRELERRSHRREENILNTVMNIGFVD